MINHADLLKGNFQQGIPFHFLLEIRDFLVNL